MLLSGLLLNLTLILAPAAAPAAAPAPTPAAPTPAPVVAAPPPEPVKKKPVKQNSNVFNMFEKKQVQEFKEVIFRMRIRIRGILNNKNYLGIRSMGSRQRWCNKCR